VRGRRAAFGVVLGLLAAGGPLAAAWAEPVAEGDRIGRYRVTRGGDGIELAVPGDGRVGWPVLAAGVAVFALGAVLAATGRVGIGIAAVLAGLALQAIGAAGLMGSATVRASRTELVREGFGGRTQRWPREAIAAVEVRRRAASAEDFKRPGTHPWDVELRARDGGRLPVRFTLRSEQEARRLARELAGALGLPAGPG
jgi:hypothetical protein